MNAPSPSNFTAIAILLALLAIVVGLPQDVLTGLLETGLIALLAAELDRSGRHVALRIVDVVAALLPRAQRADLVDEWHDHILTAGEQGLRPVLAAASIARAALSLAFRYRFRVWAAFYLMRAFTATLAMCLQALPALEKRLAPRPAFRLASLIAALTLPLNVVVPSAERWPLSLRIACAALAWLGIDAVIDFAIPAFLTSVIVSSVVGLALASAAPSVLGPRWMSRVIEWVGGDLVRAQLEAAGHNAGT
jgi:hypothetical protein